MPAFYRVFYAVGKKRKLSIVLIRASTEDEAKDKVSKANAKATIKNVTRLNVSDKK